MFQSKRSVALVAMLALSLVVVAGCRTAPVRNVEDAAITTTADGNELTREDVRDAIIRAGADLGWRMRDKEEGHLIGTLNIRAHRAQVDIRYDTSSYDITYRDSHNLDYDGEKIHSNYNGWIQNLDDAIQNELMTL